LKKLAILIEKNESESIQAIAHSLKGSSANIGANVLNTTMIAIENRMREGKPLPNDIQKTISDQVLALERTLREFVQQSPLH
jgi:HPt (histidine-containing phosphotransfer) domain-containing protein